MTADRRDLAQVLKAELDFLRAGGYRKVAGSSWRPQFIFEDSPTCLYSGAPFRRRPCVGCALISLVPTELIHAQAPCRHIPLNAEGETLDWLYRTATAEEIDAAVQKWLETEIAELAAGGQSPG